MRLHIIGSNSAGNSYILQSKTQSLVIECGLPLKEIKQALCFDISKIAGAIITHCHGDHAKYANQFMQAGIDICSSVGTLDAIAKKDNLQYEQCFRMRVLQKNKKYTIGEFMVMPFDITHDAPEPFGYLIKHDECGLVLFVTDTMYLKYKFPGLNQIIIEANYSQELLDKRLGDGDTIELVRNRVISSHMSLETCKDVLRANDLTRVNNIVLVHLSDGNSDARLFKSEIENLTGKTVNVAEAGMCIDFNIQPF